MNTPTAVPTNNRTRAQAAAERYAEHVRRPARPPIRGRIRAALPWLLAGTLAGGLVATLAYRPGPALATTHLERVFVDLNGDGAPDLLLSGEVIYNGPLAPGQP